MLLVTGQFESERGGFLDTLKEKRLADSVSLGLTADDDGVLLI